MARFHASCSPAFDGSRVRTEGASRSSPGRAHPAPAVDARRGPGWFDSSWDLERGLDVCEGLPEDARLHEWIEVCLRS
jgi:hypothetical protein